MHVGFAHLDDAAAEHDRGHRTDMRDDCEIVADQEEGHACLALEIAHEVQRLRLHRDVERRDGLVGDDQLRPGDERPRDGDALALAAGKLVGMLRRRRMRLKADGLERSSGREPGARRLLAPPSAASGSAMIFSTRWRGSSEP